VRLERTRRDPQTRKLSRRGNRWTILNWLLERSIPRSFLNAVSGVAALRSSRGSRLQCDPHHPHHRSLAVHQAHPKEIRSLRTDWHPTNIGDSAHLRPPRGEEGEAGIEASASWPAFFVDPRTAHAEHHWRSRRSRGQRRKFQAGNTLGAISGGSPDWPREFARQLHCVRVVYFPFARTRARGGALRGALSRAASDWSARRVRYARLRASGCIADSRVEGDVTLLRGWRKNARDGCYNAPATADGHGLRLASTQGHRTRRRRSDLQISSASFPLLGRWECILPFCISNKMSQK